jgi:hypothetical protein
MDVIFAMFVHNPRDGKRWPRGFVIFFFGIVAPDLE